MSRCAICNYSTDLPLSEKEEYHSNCISVSCISYFKGKRDFLCNVCEQEYLGTLRELELCDTVNEIENNDKNS